MITCIGGKKFDNDLELGEKSPTPFSCLPKNEKYFSFPPIFPLINSFPFHLNQTWHKI